MSRADVMHHYQERDDEPNPVTIPEKPAPGQMFMRSAADGLWDVYGWGPDEPELIAGSLIEPDARLLVFGGELRSLLRRQLSAMDATAMSHMNYASIAWHRDAAKLMAKLNGTADPVPPPEPGDLLDDDSLPPAVREILARGQASLAKFRAEQEAAEEQHEREEVARVAAMLEPAKAVVRSVVPAELLPLVNWQENEYRRINDAIFHSYAAELAVPGCWAILVTLTNHSGEWKLYQGFWTWSWSDERGSPTNNTDAITDFAEALAVARECWVKNQTRKRTVPL